MAENKEIKNDAADQGKAVKPVKKEIKKMGLILEPYQIILRPISTEKGYYNAASKNTYTFEVNKLATKDDIRNAVEQLFDVKVVSVATQNRKGKVRRTRRLVGKTKDWKKAMVTLSDKDRIDIF